MQNSSNAESEEASPLKLSLRDHPEIVSAWANYLETEWRPWREQLHRWERLQKAYGKLFTIWQEQRRRGEQYELVLGVGVLLWTSDGGHTICRPILTAPVTIGLEGESGCIIVGTLNDRADFALEQDMLEVDERPPIQDLEHIEQNVSTLDSPWNRQQVTSILKGWFQSLPSAVDAEYQDTLACPTRATRVPQMAFAPVLILRKRGAQTMRDVLKKIAKQLSDGGQITHGIRDLCSSDKPETQRGSAFEAGISCTNPGIFVEEILFPLPANDEQLEIVRRLGSHSGVLVQGPPGTGKSHTIVNLLSHLLACGKRVLVTSQTPRALEVLRNKVPEAILPLAVSLLREDTDSRQDLEQSIQGILRQVNTMNLVEAGQQIEDTSAARHKCQGRLADLRRRLREIREAETTSYRVPGTSYQGTAQAIAQAASQDAEQFSWLTDPIAENVDAPLTDAEIKELCSLWEQCNVQVLAYDLPPFDSFPAAGDFRNAVNAHVSARDRLAAIGGQAHGTLAQHLLLLERAQLEQLCKQAQRFIEVSDWLANRTASWITRARQEVSADGVAPWRSLDNATTQALDALVGCDGGESDADLESPAQTSLAQLLADATDLLSHIQSGKGFGVPGFRPGVVKRTAYLWKDTRFAGRRCDSPEVLASLTEHLRKQDTLDQAWQEWAEYVEPPRGTMRHRIVRLKEFCDILKAVLQLDVFISSAAGIIGTTEGLRHTRPDANWGEELLAHARFAVAELDVKDSHAALSAITDKISQWSNISSPHPFVHDLVAAAKRGDVDEYREGVAKLSQLHKDHCLAKRCQSLHTRLRIVAPVLAESLMSAVTRPDLASRLETFGRAWAWRRAQAWSDRFSAEHSADTIVKDIAQTERSYKRPRENW